MVKLYTMCCGYRAVWRRRMFWFLLTFFAIAIITVSLMSPDNKKIIDVYVVEEHHEALRHWHHLTVVNRMNRTGNMLIHIDAHSDMASPEYFPGFPLFKWPVGEQQLFTLLQRNDVFIQGAGMIGMLDHIMWIYPSWDKTSELDEYSSFFFEIGILTNRSVGERTKVFCECHTPIEIHTDEIIAGMESECSYLDETRSISEMEVKIKKEECQIKRRLLFEVIVDELALEVFEKSAWLNKPKNIILDIDEDHFGCERGGTSLEKVDIPWSIVERLNILITDLICAKNPIHEEAGDKLMKDFIAAFMDICQTARPSTACNVSGQEIADRVKGPFLQQLHLMPRMLCHDRAISVVLLQRIVEVFKRLKYNHLLALAELGFCMNTSPVTFGFSKGNAQFKICHGANTPNNTLIVIHAPDEDEVTRRMSLVRSILEHVTLMQPNVVTLCRSVRDGYTPRHLAQRIEGDIVDFFTRSHEGIQYNVIYDDNLLGGKEGWDGRYKVHVN